MYRPRDDYGFSEKDNSGALQKLHNKGNDRRSFYTNGDDAILAKVAMEYLKENLKNDNLDEFIESFTNMYNKLKASSAVDRSIPKQTVFDDYIICLEDGKKMKMLKRHLRVNYGMSFSDYKAKWNLPIDYPCTCKNYSEVRACIARKRNKKGNDEKN